MTESFGRRDARAYERMTLAGIEMDVRKEETIYFARSPRWFGFMISGRTLEDLAEKLPGALREYEEFVGEGERDLEVLKTFAKYRAEQEALALKHVDFNRDPERVATLQAIRLMCATIWPHTFATKEELDLFQAKWDEQTDRLERELAAEGKSP